MKIKKNEIKIKNKEQLSPKQKLFANFKKNNLTSFLNQSFLIAFIISRKQFKINSRQNLNLPL